jgi:hypothetical protein
MNRSKKHSSLADQQERHDGMIQRRKPATMEEVPRVPMFPGEETLNGLPVKNYSLKSLGLDSLGCEGDGHLDASISQGVTSSSGLFEAMGLDPLPEIPRFLGAQKPEPSPTPAEPEKTPPALAHAPRFGIWSDGSLSMRIRSGFIELESDEFDALVNFLDRVRAGEVS